MAALGFAVGVFAVALPSEPGLLGVGLGLLFAALHSVSFYLAYRSRLVLTACFVALFALAHGATLGDGVQFGLARNGIFVQPASVRFAALMDCLFVLGATLVSLIAQRRSRALPLAKGPQARSFLAAFLIVFAACAAAAFASGAWTGWSGIGPQAQATGTVRLELLYAPMLFAASSLGVFYVVSSSQRRRWQLARIAAALGLGVLLFVLQSRRIMFSCGIVAALVILMSPRTTRHVLRSRAATVTRVVLVGVLLLSGLVASAGWRMAASRGDLSLASGLTSSVSAVLNPSDFDADTVEERLTYLWVDSMSVEARDRGEITLDPLAALQTSVLFALPSMLYGSKWQVEPVTCESSFAARGIDFDLPCTPTTEGYAAGGVVGVLLAAILWGLFIALCDWLVRCHAHGARMVGLLMFTPVTTIETGLFPMVQGARAALIVLAMVFSLTLFFRLLGRYARIERPRMAGHPKAPHGL